MRDMVIITESDVVKTEADGRFSRDEDTLASGSGVVITGTVLGEITADGATKGKFKPPDPAATDGTEVAAAIILQHADATSADQTVVNLKRHAQVVLQALRWPDGITDSEKSTALDQLASRGIVARNGV